MAGGLCPSENWGLFSHTLTALKLGSCRGFSFEFGSLPFPLSLVSLPTLCFESFMAAQIMAAQTETSGGELVEYLSVEPASQTPFGSEQGQRVVVWGGCGPGCLALWSEF